MPSAERKITYKQSNDGSQAYAFPDFSSALKQNQLGIALCFQNPQEDKLCKRHLIKIERQKRKQEGLFYHSQKTFFVRQVFEKGLNPYTRKSHGDVTESGHGDAERPAGSKTLRESTPRSKDRPLPMARSLTMSDIPQTINEEEKTNGDARKEEKPKRDANDQPKEENDSSRLPFLTQPTDDEALEPSKPKRLTALVRVTAVEHNHRPGFLPPLQEEEDYMENEFQEEYKKYENTKVSRTSTGKRHLIDLKKHPEMLFPKLHDLVSKGPLEAQTHAPKPIEREAPIRLRQPTMSKPIARPDANDTKARTVKMIQRLTTNLPDQLMETAREQVRVMSNSDAIYEQKRRLLQENKEKIDHNPADDDSRWINLENSLSPTHGVSLKWRRMPGNKWSFR